MALQVEFYTARGSNVPYVKLNGNRFAILLSRLGEFNKPGSIITSRQKSFDKFIKTIEQTKGVEVIKVTDLGTLICQLDPQSIGTNLIRLEKKLLNRVIDKVQRNEKAARKAARPRSRFHLEPALASS